MFFILFDPLEDAYRFEDAHDVLCSTTLFPMPCKGASLLILITVNRVTEFGAKWFL